MILRFMVSKLKYKKRNKNKKLYERSQDIYDVMYCCISFGRQIQYL